MSGGVDVLAAMDGWCRLIAHTSGNPNAPDDLREASAAVAELIEEAQRVADGTTGDLHYLRAALARVGGAA